MKIKFSWGVRLADGREICNLATKAGRDEYFRRLRVMWLRQKKRCCLEGHIEGCPGYLKIAEATFEHQDGRGMEGGHRDDRIERPNKRGQLRFYNGVAHWECNRKKGSTRIDYTHFYDA